LEKAKLRFRDYIAKMNRVSVILILAGVFGACALFLYSLLLFHMAPRFASPLQLVILSENLFERGATLILVAPMCAFILDLFWKALGR